jgi:hypothetical protein
MGVQRWNYKEVSLSLRPGRFTAEEKVRVLERMQRGSQSHSGGFWDNLDTSLAQIRKQRLPQYGFQFTTHSSATVWHYVASVTDSGLRYTIKIKDNHWGTLVYVSPCFTQYLNVQIFHFCIKVWIWKFSLFSKGLLPKDMSCLKPIIIFIFSSLNTKTAILNGLLEIRNAAVYFSTYCK